MKIEVGKTYRTRGGDVMEIVHDDGTRDWPLCGRDRFGETWYSREGVPVIGTSEDDVALVAEVANPRQVSDKIRSEAPEEFVRLSLGNEVRITDDPLPAIRHDIRKIRRNSIVHYIATCLLAIALLVFANDSNAADIAAMPNAAGGEIVLTTERGSCPDLYLLAYSRGDNGTVITGCWLPGTRYVLIKWSESGEVKLFAYDQFTPLVRQVPAAERRL